MHVLTEHLAQRRVQEVRSRVIALRVFPSVGVDRRVRVLARLEVSLRDLHQMTVKAWERRRRVDDDRETCPGADLAHITDLPATFGIERRPGQEDLEATPARIRVRRV